MHSGLTLFIDMLKLSRYKEVPDLLTLNYPPIKVNPNKVYYVEKHEKGTVVHLPQVQAHFTPEGHLQHFT